ncbi:MAG: OB-fold nucleic acid binding domain-containing protein [Candidatus Bathyarchaeia archaeon]|nr:DNA-binding protein [Candidatus Bathyarchaeota archaeon]
MKIKELRNGMKHVNVEGKIVDKSEPREVVSRYQGTTHTVANAVIADETGKIKLTLWNDQIDQVNVNDNVKIENGYVTSFRGELQLNVGKYGKLKVE